MIIAVLIAAHNRKRSTLECLRSLYSQRENVPLKVFLVDDGSTDGSAGAVKERYQGVRIIHGGGNLYWAKAMRKAWEAAVSESEDWDGFLWLNDDTELVADALEKILAVNDGDKIVVGELANSAGDVVYGTRSGGLFTGNCVFVPTKVYERLGMICGEYSHAWADSDYAMQAKRAKIGAVSAGVVGKAEGHPNRPSLKGLPLRKRLKLLQDPKGWNVHDLWLYRRRNWGYVAAIFSCLHMITHVVVGDEFWRKVSPWILLGIFLFAATYPIIPFHDDWSYATAPNVAFSLENLLPGREFWRPFDALLGGILGQIPLLFPIANKLLIVFGHLLSVFVLSRVLIKLSTNRTSKCNVVIATLYFAASSGIVAALVNTDTVNQIWCFFWGCVAVWQSLRLNGGLINWLIVLGTLFVSVLCKESGISWCAIVPALVFAKTRSASATIKYLTCGICAAVLYFGLRFVLQGGFSLGGDGDYALGVSISGLIRNLAIGTLMPISGIDGLAFATKRYCLGGVSAISSLVAWLFLLVFDWRGDRRSATGRVLLLLFAATVMALPHCLCKWRHPAEIHFYPVIFAGALYLAMYPWHSISVVAKRCVIMLGCIVSAVGWGDKLLAVYKHSAETKDLFERISEYGIDFRKPVHFVVEDTRMPSYSVFQQTPAHGLDFGNAFRKLNEWKSFEHYVVNESSASDLPEYAQVVNLW